MNTGSYLCFVFALLFSITQVQAQNVSKLNTQENEFLITMDKMLSIEALPGEVLHIVEGKANGFESLTIGISETKPGSGAPPHLHQCEEAHVVLDGTVEYRIGDKIFVAKAPYVVRIPANAVHSFTNIGTNVINVIGIFPRNTEAEIDPKAK